VPSLLTAREHQVLVLIAQGLASSATAMRLGASVHTVRNTTATCCASWA
jgi:DNA-binding CsgD family transcriptional regulator